jgi:hypothetical protein
MAETAKITLSVPKDLLKRIRRLAADREMSVSALVTDVVTRLIDEDRQYRVARKRALGAIRSHRSLGTMGGRSWTRDDLHDR